MLSKKLLKHLESHKAKFEKVEHKVVYTAYDAAATMKVKLNEIGKSLLVKFNKPFVDGAKPYAIVIVGADKNIDLVKLKKTVSDWAVKRNKELRKNVVLKGKKPVVDIYNKIGKVSIPKEKELKDKFKAKPGAMAAFGSLYKLPVFIDKGFLKSKKIILAGDSYTESVKMAAKEFHKLEQGMEGVFALAKKVKKKINSKSQKPKKKLGVKAKSVKKRKK